MLTEREINLEMLNCAMRTPALFRLGTWDGGHYAFSPDLVHGHIFPSSWGVYVMPPLEYRYDGFDYRLTKSYLIGAVVLEKGEKVHGEGRTVLRAFRGPLGNTLYVNESALKQFKQFAFAKSRGGPADPIFIYEALPGSNAELTGFIMPALRR